VEQSVVDNRLLDDIIDSTTHANRPKDQEALPELHHLRGTTSDP
jgi:hypothetical protein